MFNLDDSDEEDFQLTHFGQSLSFNDDFENNEIEGSDQSDDDAETRELKEMRRKRKLLAREAGIDLEDSEKNDGEEDEEEEGPAKKKSKQEVMKEVIAKSKFYKFERQMAKEKDEMVIDAMDQKQNVEALLGELRDAGSFTKAKQVLPGPNVLVGELKEKKAEADYDDDYEQRVRELAFERRAQAADRAKTEEEAAKENAEKLKKLEAQRLARMNGEVSDEEEANEESDQDAAKGEFVDDNDDINDAGGFGLKSALDIKKEQEDNDDSEDDDEDDDSVNGNLLVDDEFQAADSDEGEELSESEKETSKKPKAAKKESKGSKLAYTFEMPEDVTELLEIFGQYPAKEQPVIIERIMTLYDPRLNPGNKEKIASFTCILAEYVILTADVVPETSDEDIAPVLDTLISILKKLAEKHTESLAQFFRQQLNEADSRLRSAISKNKNKYITENPSHLFLFTVIAIIFSTSDHFNQIVTPASLLLGLHLSQVRLLTPSDILAGLYTASTALTYQRIAKRYIPEITIFLARALYLLSPTQIKNKAIPREIFLGVIDPKSRFPASKDTDAKEYKAPLALRQLHTLPETPEAELQKVYTQLYIKTLQVLEAYMTLWTDDQAFIEIFTPFLPLVKDHPSTYDKLTKRLSFAQKSRAPLTLQSHRPIPLASKIPKFEENYSVDKKSYDPDVVRREHKKLQSAVKKERKGALRELRKDTHFITREKLRERKEHDKEYHEKLDKLIRTVATEEGAEKNKYERERKQRKKKH